MSTSGVYGDYKVPFNGSGSFLSNASIVLTENHWWIPQFEIPFLTIIILVGVVGNISIIGAIVVEKKLKFAGNAFIVNLAVADLVVTSYILPGVLANVIANKNLFPPALCSLTAVILSVSCIGSMYSLMLVSINRYVAIVHNVKYTTIFNNKNIAWMIVALWLWSLLITIPPAFGWGDYRYHKKIHVCMYDCDAEKYITFTVSYVCLSIILPFLVTCFCYRGVFVAFNKNRSKVRRMSEPNTTTTATTTTDTTAKKSKVQNMSETNTTTTSTTTTDRIAKKSCTDRENRERRLVITLFAAVSLFTICWMPYALIILINHSAPAFFKRSAAWLAFSNSAMNSILYGVLNRNFRNGYKKVWGRVFSCCVSRTTKMVGQSATANQSGDSLPTYQTKPKNGLYDATNFSIASNATPAPMQRYQNEVEDL